MNQRRLVVGLIMRRLLFLPMAVFIAVTASFALVNLVPGNPAKVIAGAAANQAEITSISHRLGLDHPYLSRYWDYLSGLVQGRMGSSYYTGLPVVHQIAIRLPATLELIIPALVLASMLALAVGVVAAAFQGRLLDRGLSMMISFFQGMPDFLLGNLLIFLLFHQLNLLGSPSGQLALGDLPPPHRTGAYLLDAMLAGNWSLAGDAFSHLVLPVLTLTLVTAAPLARTARAAFVEATTSSSLDYARSLGLRRSTTWLYIWREARGPILTYGAFLFAALVGGDAIVEIVFSWGGLGSWSVTSIEQLDLPVTEGFVVVVATATILVFLLLDALNLVLDPRLRHAATTRPSLLTTPRRWVLPLVRREVVGA